MKAEQLKHRIEVLNERFLGAYEKCAVASRECFRAPNGMIFALDYIESFGALVIEYAEDYEEAELCRFEDGDLFFLEDMDEKTMFKAMLREIGQ